MPILQMRKFEVGEAGDLAMVTETRVAEAGLQSPYSFSMGFATASC